MFQLTEIGNATSVDIFLVGDNVIVHFSMGYFNVGLCRLRNMSGFSRLRDAIGKAVRVVVKWQLVDVRGLCAVLQCQL